MTDKWVTVEDPDSVKKCYVNFAKQKIKWDTPPCARFVVPFYASFTCLSPKQWEGKACKRPRFKEDMEASRKSYAGDP